MKLSDFDYPLPAELIAQHPAPERTASRLLDASGETLVDRTFTDVLGLIEPQDLLVFNNTKVIKARLHGRKESGGSVEVLVERILSDGQCAYAHVRASKSPKPGSRLYFADDISAVMVRRVDDLFELRFEGTRELHAMLEAIGEVPLPPYITHAADSVDAARYQTVYACYPGSVAAPTAGLHFDETLLAALSAKGVASVYVTLHVGAGTFQPVRDDDVSKHVMHSEWCEVPQSTVEAIAAARARGGRVIAVGTTTVRTLESAAISGRIAAGTRETNIFITPGFVFQVVDVMLTNFHLPKSTLMMLVSAFAGHEKIMRAYAHAVAARYRFFSYGDAMLLSRARVGKPKP